MATIQKFSRLFLSVFILFAVFQATSTIFAETEDTVSVQVRVEGLDRTIAPETELEVSSFDLQEYAGGNQPIERTSPRAIHAIIQALEQSGIDQFNLTHGGNYIEEIDGLYEFGHGFTSGWMYYVNNEWVPTGVLEKEIGNDDSIVVVYVENYIDNTFTWFENKEMVVEAGQPFQLDLIGVKYDAVSPVKGASILVNEEEYQENGEQIVTDENGQITLNIDEPGEYDLSAERFSDGFRNITRPYAKVTVTEPKDVTPPTMTIDGLKDGMEVDESILTFSVNAEDDQGGEVALSATLNGDAFEIQDRSNQIQLAEGSNVIEITAKDEAGNVITERFEVVYKPPKENESSDEADHQNVSAEQIEQAIEAASQYILTKGVSSEWEAIGIARAGKTIPTNYADIFERNVQDQVIGGLDTGRIKITDIERLTIAAVVLGLDPQNIDGFNLIEQLYNSPLHRSGMDTMIMQGNNGLTFALIALDTLDFEVPDDAKWNRQAIIDALLASQNSNGSWPLNEYFDTPDIDVTGMVLIGLSEYTHIPEVDEALERAVDWLSNQQMDNGGFFAGDFVGGITSESTSQVVIGLSSYGIDSAGDIFTKEGKSLIDHLLAYQNDDGGFKHTMEDNSSDPMATEQALQALVAYHYYLTGQGSLYQFDPNDIEPPVEEDDDEENSQPINEEKFIKHKTEINENQEMKITLDEKDVKETKDTTLIVQPNQAKDQTLLQVELDKAVVDSLIQNNNNLKIDKEEATLDIPPSILSLLQSQADGSPVTIRMEKYEADHAVGSIYDFTLMVGDIKVSDFNQDEITLTLQVNPIAKNPKVFYFNEKTNEWERIESGQYDSSNGTITFTTSHFSVFGVFEAEEEDLEQPTTVVRNNVNTEPKNPTNDDSSEEEELENEESVNTENEKPVESEIEESVESKIEESVESEIEESVESENEEPEESENEESEELENEESENDENGVSTGDSTDDGSAEIQGSSQESNGDKLPQTSNNLYAYLLAGMLLLLIGTFFIIYQRKKIRHQA